MVSRPNRTSFFFLALVTTPPRRLEKARGRREVNPRVVWKHRGRVADVEHAKAICGGLVRAVREGCHQKYLEE